MHVTSTRLESLIAPAVGRPEATISNNVTALMRSDHINKGRRGRYGGAAMTTRCAVNALIGSAVDRPKGMLIGDCVDRVREMPLVMSTGNALSDASPDDRMAMPANFIDGLSLPSRCTDFGNAVESVIDDWRSGTLDRWAKGGTVWVSIDVVPFSHASITLDRKSDNQIATFSFGDWRAFYARRYDKVERITRIPVDVFRDIVDALGPLDNGEFGS